jgi:hypothetical protein
VSIPDAVADGTSSYDSTVKEGEVQAMMKDWSCRFLREEIRMRKKTFVERAQKISYTKLIGTIRYVAHEIAQMRE